MNSMVNVAEMPKPIVQKIKLSRLEHKRLKVAAALAGKEQARIIREAALAEVGRILKTNRVEV